MPDDGHRYYVPWRDDPRPISGLLQGAYAYLGVTGFWRTRRQPDGDPAPCGQRNGRSDLAWAAVRMLEAIVETSVRRIGEHVALRQVPVSVPEVRDGDMGVRAVLATARRPRIMIYARTARSPSFFGS
jgi:hypothetical protein